MILICVITSLYCVLYQCFLSSFIPLIGRPCQLSSMTSIVPNPNRPFAQSCLPPIVPCSDRPFEQSSLPAVVPASDRTVVPSSSRPCFRSSLRPVVPVVLFLYPFINTANFTYFFVYCSFLRAKSCLCV